MIKRKLNERGFETLMAFEEVIEGSDSLREGLAGLRDADDGLEGRER